MKNKRHFPLLILGIALPRTADYQKNQILVSSSHFLIQWNTEKEPCIWQPVMLLMQGSDY